MTAGNRGSKKHPRQVAKKNAEPSCSASRESNSRNKFTVALLFRGPQHEGKDEFSSFVPMGLFNVLKSLNDAGYQASLFNLSHLTPGQLEKCLGRIRADAILISAFYGCHNEAYTIARLSKKAIPSSPIVLGGPLALLGREILSRIDAVDFIIQGEGEESSIQLLDVLFIKQGKMEEIPGLCFRTISGIVANPPRLLENIDRYFFLPSEVLPLCHDVHPENLAVLISSRGCPYSCFFCSSTAIWRNRLRHHHPDLLINYLADLRRTTGALYFSLRDENFLANRRHVSEFTKKLADSNLYFLWNAQGSAHLVDDDLARLLAEAGCDQLQIGVETISPRLLRLLGKKTDSNVVRHAAQSLRRQCIRPFGYFIYGMGETDEEAEENICFIKDSGLLDGVASPLVLYPGTELARNENSENFFSSSEMLLFHPESQKKYRKRYEKALEWMASRREFTKEDLFQKDVSPNCVSALARHYHHLRHGEYSVVEKELLAFSENNPENPWPLVTLADYYDQSGATTRAEALRRKAARLINQKDPR